MPKPRIERILVPIDLSTFTLPALRLADLFREKLGAKVTVLHANEPVYPLVAYEDIFGTHWEPPVGHAWLEAKLRQYINAAVWDPEIFDLQIVDGLAADVITASAKSLRADLIIMGTHGRTGVRRALLGSVAERVLHKTDVPLLTVNAVTRMAERNAVRSILCPVSFTPFAHDALQYAAALTQTFHANLTVLNVDEDCMAADETEHDFGMWVDPAVRSRCSFRRIALRGDAADEVLDVANYLQADLIVIGAEHRRFSDATVVGTATERITRFARQPVLTVMHGDASVAAA